MADPSAAWRKRMAAPATDDSIEHAAPSTPSEIELKLRVRAPDLERLRARLGALGGAPRRRRIDNIYFDTPDLRLAAARAALRLRSVREGRRTRWVQTFKTEDQGMALAQRGEWETPVEGAAIEPARLSGAPLARLLAGDPVRLHAQFRTRFERLTWRIERHGALIEAALDRGQISAGYSSAAICELELELIDGPRLALLELALELCGASGARHADLALVPCVDSKAVRGYRLAQGAPPAAHVPPAAPAPHVLGAKLGAALAARRWTGLQMNALLANVEGIGASVDIEYVHQARVALRRLRSGLDLLATEREVPAAIRAALKRWSDYLGEVRDWDVFCAQQLPALARHAGTPGAPSWMRLDASSARRQARARALLRRRLEDPGFAEFVLRVLHWSLALPPHAGKRLGDAAPRLLRARAQRLAGAARNFARLSETRQHKLRIEAKRLRYGIEMLRSVLPARGQRARLRALARFQKAAGAARDCLQAQLMIQRLSRSAVVLDACRAWCTERFREQAARAQRLAADLGARP